MKFPNLFSVFQLRGKRKPSGTPGKKTGFLGYIIAGSILLGIIGIAAGLVFIVGIPGSYGNTVAKILTNIPEAAAYVDLFNISQDRYKLILSYSPAPAADLKNGNASADMVIGKGIGYSEALELFQQIDYMFHEGGLISAAFYQDALALGRKDTRLYLIPVSFDLPAFMFGNSLSGSLPSLALSMEKVRERSSEFNVVSKGSYTAIGFSPLWNPEFLVVLADLFDASFREATPRDIAWDEKAVQNAIAYSRTWIRETNGGQKADSGFREKYLYDPGYRLIKNGRIRFTVTTGAQYFLMAEENRDSLDFRWMERNDRIPVSDTITFLGIPRKAANKDAVEAFIRWFFQTENQKRLIETARLKQIRTFGIAGGFSTLMQVNEMILPQIYPLLLGHIPSQNYLKFPFRLPAKWEDLKSDVIIPWFVEAVTSETESPSTETLRTQIHSWRLAEGEL